MRRSGEAMGLTSRAAVLDGVKGNFSMAEAAVPEAAPGSIIVRQEMCGICGTDVHVFQGHMASVPMPVVLGHEIVGTIVALEGDETLVLRVKPDNVKIQVTRSSIASMVAGEVKK